MATYVGESGFSSYTRGANHRAELRKENQHNALWSHAVEHHGFKKGQGAQVEVTSMYNMKVIDTQRSSCKRLISEAIRIEEAVRETKAMKSPSNNSSNSASNSANRIVLNNKSQWYQPGLIRSRASPGVEY